MNLQIKKVHKHNFNRETYKLSWEQFKICEQKHEHLKNG